MCGISGYWDLKRKISKDTLYQTVHRMNEQIRYRGPDEEKVYQDGSLCIGMRRLAVIDLQGGSQPLYNEDRSIAVMYNGEIYNFRNIRKTLLKKGHKFRTESDTEVIVHAFEEYGTDSFNLFDGMFAFALHDTAHDVLYLVRDRMGEKPLYYSVTQDYVLFGSELKCLMSAELIEKNINIRALNQYFQLTYIPSPLTIYENVWKVKAGHFLKITNDGNTEDTEYWDIPVTRSGQSYKDAVKTLRRLMASSVKQRMISDVPLGAFLSGGVDSASITGLMSRAAGKPLQTFTMGFNLKEFDERKRAKEAAKHNHTKHYEKVADYASFPCAMRTIMEYMDEPFADSSELPAYLLSKFAKENVTVILTGDGGDELFAGYNKYLIAYYGKIYQKIPGIIKDKIIFPAVHKSGSSKGLMRKIRKVVENADKSPWERHRALMHMGVKEEEIGQLMTPAYQDEASLVFIDEYYNKHPDATELQRSLYTDLKVVLEGDMLVKTDRMSMLNSLETRIPLLSKDMIEFSMSLPDEYKLKGKKRKRILKDSMKPVLPDGFDRHPKSGFEVPVAQWMRDEMRGEVERYLNRDHIESQGILNPEYVEKIKKEHFEGKRNRRDELWVIYIFEKWCEREKI